MSGWDFGISVYGLHIGIHLSSEDFRDLVLDHLPPGWQFASPYGVSRVYTLETGKGEHRLYVDGTLLYFHRSFDEILRWFESDLQIYVAEMCPDRVFVHAGVVGWRGKGIVLPGRSFSGKTTLICSLLRAGAEYYSDEYAVFDKHGRIHPYPRRLGVRSHDGVRTRRKVEDFDAANGAGSLPASLIVATRFILGAEWNPRRLSPGCAALLLFSNTVSARRSPDFALSTIRRAVAGAVALESARGESDEIVDLLLNELADEEMEDYVSQREEQRICSSGTRA